jgi:MerR family transcriptional regulator, light-induced transcriptional regulator
VSQRSLSDGDDPTLPRYTVRAVAERLRVPTATLRSWNQRYGVGPLDHAPGQHRLYSEADIAVLRQMRVMIGRGVNAASAARVALDALAPQRADVSAVLDAASELDVAAMTELLDRNVRHHGVVDTWDRLICPAFAQIEARQADRGGCIDVEHALSWTVARTLQRVPMAAADGGASVLLACTGAETHTLALEALRAALGECGRPALMLGATVPAAALVDALAHQRRPATVVLWAHTAATADPAMVKAGRGAGAVVVVAGPGWDPTVTRGLSRLETLSDAVRHLTT